MIPLRDDNPTSGTAWVTIGLIAACALAFLWQLGQGIHASASGYGLVPDRLTNAGHAGTGAVSPWVSVVSSMFLHGGWLHLGGNMLYLWIFGNNIEDATGRLRFLAFYLLSGTGAALTQVVMAPGSDIPMIGASGAVSGVLGAYLLLYPRARVSTLVFIVIFVTVLRVRAWVLLCLWFAMQALPALTTPAGAPGVAWFAHVGGFLAGMMLIPWFKQKHVRWFDDGGVRSREHRARMPRIWFRKRGPWE